MDDAKEIRKLTDAENLIAQVAGTYMDRAAASRQGSTAWAYYMDNADTLRDLAKTLRNMCGSP